MYKLSFELSVEYLVCRPILINFTHLVRVDRYKYKTKYYIKACLCLFLTGPKSLDLKENTNRLDLNCHDIKIRNKRLVMVIVLHVFSSMSDVQIAFDSSSNIDAFLPV